MRGVRQRAFVRDERVLWRHIFDGVLLCLPESGELIVVTGPGADLWAMLDEPQSVESAAQQLAQRYTIAAQDIAAGIEPVIDDLVQRAAIKPLRSAMDGDRADGTVQDAVPERMPERL